MDSKTLNPENFSKNKQENTIKNTTTEKIPAFLRSQIEKYIENEIENEALSFSDKYFKDDGCCIVCQALIQQSNNKIISLDLSGNEIREIGAQALSELLKSSDCVLEKLLLEWNSFGYGSAMRPLVESLCFNKTLIHLDLRNNQLSPKGGFEIATILKKNNTIRHLDIRWNNLKREGGNYIANALKEYNNTLVECLLSGNNVPVNICITIENYCKRNNEQKLIKNSQIKTTEILQGQMLQRESNMMNKQQEILTKQSEEYERTISYLKEQLNRMELDNSYTLKMLSSKQEEISQFSNKYISLESKYNEEIKKNTQLLIQIEKENELHENEKMELLNLNKKLQEDVNNMPKLNSELKECKCDNEKYQTIIKNLESEMIETKNKLKEKTQQIIQIEKDFENSNKNIDQIVKEKLEECNNSNKSLQIELEKCQKNLSDTTKSLNTLKSEQLTVKIEKEETITEFERKIKTECEHLYSSQISTLNDRLNVLSKQRDSLNENLSNASKEHKIIITEAMSENTKLSKLLQKEQNNNIELQNLLHQLEKEIKKCNSELDKKEYHIEKSSKEIYSLQKQLDEMEITHESYLDKLITNQTNDISQLNLVIQEKEAQIKQLNKQLKSQTFETSHLKKSHRRKNKLFFTAMDKLVDVMKNESDSSNEYSDEEVEYDSNIIRSINNRSYKRSPKSKVLQRHSLSSLRDYSEK